MELNTSTCAPQDVSRIAWSCAMLGMNVAELLQLLAERAFVYAKVLWLQGFLLCAWHLRLLG